MASETTAAPIGKVGEVRRDPMAMLPFCGYNMGDYFEHWLRHGHARSPSPPKIFHVNWFRTDDERQVPLARLRREPARAAVDPRAGEGPRRGAVETPIGLVPTGSAIDWDALPLTAADRQLLLAVSRGEWAAEVREIHAFFERFGERLPRELARALGTLERDLARVSA